jgi:hypothetical protein
MKNPHDTTPKKTKAMRSSTKVMMRWRTPRPGRKHNAIGISVASMMRGDAKKRSSTPGFDRNMPRPMIAAKRNGAVLTKNATQSKAMLFFLSFIF